MFRYPRKKKKTKRNETKEETNKRERRKNSKSNVTYYIDLHYDSLTHLNKLNFLLQFSKMKVCLFLAM